MGLSQSVKMTEPQTMCRDSPLDTEEQRWSEEDCTSQENSVLNGPVGLEETTDPSKKEQLVRLPILIIPGFMSSGLEVKVS